MGHSVYSPQLPIRGSSLFRTKKVQSDFREPGCLDLRLLAVSGPAVGELRSVPAFDSASSVSGTTKPHLHRSHWGPRVSHRLTRVSLNEQNLQRMSQKRTNAHPWTSQRSSISVVAAAEGLAEGRGTAQGPAGPFSRVEGKLASGLRAVSAGTAEGGACAGTDLESAGGKKMIVGVDVDEVLGFFVATLNEFCLEEYQAEYDVSEYHVYDFKTVWGCSQEEANQRVHAFFRSKHFNQGIPPIPGALQTLLRLSAECRLVVVTSRQHVIRQPTLEWLDAHYPGVFADVHFGNHYALEGKARPKSEICRDLGVDLLIDDNPKYAMECVEHGIEVLLFDWEMSYPWAKTECGPTHPLITRVRDWHEVERVLSRRMETEAECMS